ncbi:hypothetical protein MKW92_022267 [Papaver armeniacum]|nr:hypothetical protein MKW92_022267 [Papaver armeniacum]
MVRKEIQDETDRITGKSNKISSVPIHLSIYSQNVVNLTMIDLPGLTKVAIDGQPQSVVQDIENMVWSYVEKPNSIILAISPANQDIATSDAIKLAKEVDPQGERTFGVLTKLDLMDKEQMQLKFSKVEQREYFATSSDYGHLSHKMGSEYLAKLLSKHLESFIRTIIPSITSLINKSIEELEREMNQLGKPVADSGARLFTILELCRAFDRVFKEHLDGGRPGGDRIYGVFDNQLPAVAEEAMPDQHLSLIIYFRGPAKASADAIHNILKNLSVFSRLQSEIAAASYESCRRFREEGRKTTLRLVDMELLSVLISQETSSRRTQRVTTGIGSNVFSYVRMVSDTLKNNIPKAVVHCQVREAKDVFSITLYTIGQKESNQLAELLNEDPALAERRQQCAKRLNYISQQGDEMDSVALAR